MITINVWLAVASIAVVFLSGTGVGYLHACQDHRPIAEASKESEG